MHGINRVVVRFAAVSLALLFAGSAYAQDTAKIGLILPLTGAFSSTGRQVETAVRLYMQQHGNMVAGKKIELIIRDDGNVADTTKRIAQELVVNDKVAVLAGFGLTPLALATAPISAQAKVPQIVMAAATVIITERSPYIVRTSSVTTQLVSVAEWAPKNGIKKVVTLVSDFAPGIDIEKAFIERFTKAGGEILGSLRVPLANPDFAPFLQRMRDLSPEAIFVFVPAGVGATFMRQFVERGLDKSGIKVIGTGDMTDDDILNNMGDVALGITTSHHYSAAHPSPLNKEFVEAFKKASGLRPNFMGVGGYDGMHLIYEALKKTNGSTDGDALIAAMKGMKWESPRGPISIDPDTRDIVQNIYIRRVERVSGELYNVEFATFEAVREPHAGAK